MVFPGTALAGGVTHQEYLKFISELRSPDALLDELLDHITYIESALDSKCLEGLSQFLHGDHSR